MEEKITTALRERMSNAMCLRGVRARIQEADIGARIELARYGDRSPTALEVEKAQAYLLRKRSAPPSWTCKIPPLSVGAATRRCGDWASSEVSPGYW